jgi:hypothetical protein
LNSFYFLKNFKFEVLSNEILKKFSCFSFVKKTRNVP